MTQDELVAATDAELVAGIIAREEPALGEAFRRHGQAVIGLARRLLNDPTQAEDLAQEIFVRLWQQPERFDATRGKLRTLLLTQAHGLGVDTIRSQNARRRREEKVSYDAPALMADVDAEILAVTAAEQVRAALAELPAVERTAIELAYFGANTYRQVAEMLGVPEGTIKTRIRTGLRRLNESLADVHGDTPAGAAPTNTAPATISLVNGLKGRS